MANNQYVNKVEYGNETLIDLTEDTVSEGQLLRGVTAHDRSGAAITGTWSLEDEKPSLYEGYISTDPQSVVTFDAKGADNPIALTAAIEPVQNLHGYDHPWPAGAINVIPPAAAGTYTSPSGNITVVSDGKGKYTITGTSNENESVEIPLSGTFVCPPSTTHKLCIMNNAASDYVVLNFYYNGTFVTDWAVTPINRVATSYSQMANQSINKIVIQVRNNTTANIVMTPMIIPQASDNSPFTPYSNICPISGWTGAKVNRTGKNLIGLKHSPDRSAYNNGVTVSDETDEHFTLTSNGRSWRYRSLYYALKAGTYTLSMKATSTTSGFEPVISLYYPTDTPGISTSTGFDSATQATSSTFTLIEDCVIEFRFFATLGTATTQSATFYDVQLELGSTATEYEPYTSQEYDISFPSEAGTVYGGTLTVNKDGTGTLVVDKVFKELSPDWDWVKSSAYPGGYFASIGSVDSAIKINTSFICSHAKTTYYIADYDYGTCYCDSSLNFRLFDENSTLQDWKNYITAQANNGTPIHVVCSLSSLLVYNLTAPQVHALLGLNNVWADTGGILSLSYSDAVEGGTDLTLITTGERYEWNKAVQKVLPSVSSTDNDKVLKVSNGQWVAGTLDISGKADKVANATNGNVATLDANGNLIDSGKTIGTSVPSNAVFTDTTYSVATISNAGLMSAADRIKLDSVALNATANVVSNSLSDTSTTNALSAAKGKALQDTIGNTTMGTTATTLTGAIAEHEGDISSLSEQIGNMSFYSSVSNNNYAKAKITSAISNVLTNYTVEENKSYPVMFLFAGQNFAGAFTGTINVTSGGIRFIIGSESEVFHGLYLRNDGTVSSLKRLVGTDVT